MDNTEKTFPESLAPVFSDLSNFRSISSLSDQSSVDSPVRFSSKESNDADSNVFDTENICIEISRQTSENNSNVTNAFNDTEQLNTKNLKSRHQSSTVVSNTTSTKTNNQDECTYKPQYLNSSVGHSFSGEKNYIKIKNQSSFIDKANRLTSNQNELSFNSSVNHSFSKKNKREKIKNQSNFIDKKYSHTCNQNELGRNSNVDRSSSMENNDVEKEIESNSVAKKNRKHSNKHIKDNKSSTSDKYFSDTHKMCRNDDTKGIVSLFDKGTEEPIREDQKLQKCLTKPVESVPVGTKKVEVNKHNIKNIALESSDFKQSTIKISSFKRKKHSMNNMSETKKIKPSNLSPSKYLFDTQKMSKNDDTKVAVNNEEPLHKNEIFKKNVSKFVENALEDSKKVELNKHDLNIKLESSNLKQTTNKSNSVKQKKLGKNNMLKIKPSNLSSYFNKEVVSEIDSTLKTGILKETITNTEVNENINLSTKDLHKENENKGTPKLGDNKLLYDFKGFSQNDTSLQNLVLLKILIKSFQEEFKKTFFTGFNDEEIQPSKSRDIIYTQIIKMEENIHFLGFTEDEAEVTDGYRYVKQLLEHLKQQNDDENQQTNIIDDEKSFVNKSKKIVENNKDDDKSYHWIAEQIRLYNLKPLRVVLERLA